MSDIRCKVGWHDWNKYGDIVNSYGGLIQFRDCKRCNIIDYAKCYGNTAAPDDVNGSIAHINAKHEIK